MKQVRSFAAAVAVLWFGLTASGARAQVTSGESASVLVFPKVIVNASWDTVIQLSNDADRPAHARCYYVDGAPTSPGLPPGPLNPPLWTQVDFGLTLLTQQPTHWVVSQGRPVDPTDNTCGVPAGSCGGTGFDPGRIPPVPDGFTGELVCIEVDASGAPWSGNALGGHATLKQRETGEIVAYPGIGIVGLQTNDGDGTLCLGGAEDGACPSGAEYQGCSDEWFVAHPSNFDDRAFDGEAESTGITVVPCTLDFLTQVPTTVVVQFQVVNEFEQAFTAAEQVECWADLQLADVNPIFDRDTIGGSWLLTRLRASSSSPGGFLVVQQSERRAGLPQLFAAAATVPPQSDRATHADRIQIPEEAVQ